MNRDGERVERSGPAGAVVAELDRLRALADEQAAVLRVTLPLSRAEECVSHHSPLPAPPCP